MPGEQILVIGVNNKNIKIVTESSLYQCWMQWAFLLIGFMTTFESDIKKATFPDEKIFTFISDFNNFGHLIPQDKVKDWQSTEDTCKFSVEGIGEAGLKIIDKEPFKTVKYTADGKVPFNFYLWIQLKQVAENDTRIKLTIKADLNPMMKMMVSKHVKKFLNMLGDAIAAYNKY